MNPVGRTTGEGRDECSKRGGRGGVGSTVWMARKVIR